MADVTAVRIASLDSRGIQARADPLTPRRRRAGWTACGLFEHERYVVQELLPAASGQSSCTGVLRPSQTGQQPSPSRSRTLE